MMYGMLGIENCMLHASRSTSTGDLVNLMGKCLGKLSLGPYPERILAGGNFK